MKNCMSFINFLIDLIHLFLAFIGQTETTTLLPGFFTEESFRTATDPPSTDPPALYAVPATPENILPPSTPPVIETTTGSPSGSPLEISDTTSKYTNYLVPETTSEWHSVETDDLLSPHTPFSFGFDSASLVSGRSSCECLLRKSAITLCSPFMYSTWNE